MTNPRALPVDEQEKPAVETLLAEPVETLLVEPVETLLVEPVETRFRINDWIAGS